ncbi:hypothetical protein [Propioniciclava flava]|uniref:YtxH domain-containing protein n=1 Tax=Propioniciclava flava TaxID=2072026 RepID=A0A4Q2EL70_9ACTN|nr:hypothetical protein [Propioniciclava flava]RXW33526.1 hypothetical protein C1706_01870 [Propioniciclava flava]
MSRTFWFLTGVAASAFVAVKGRQYYRRLTPAGMAEELERKAEGVADQAKVWVDDFAASYAAARAAKQSELTALLTKDERRQLS